MAKALFVLCVLAMWAAVANAGRYQRILNDEASPPPNWIDCDKAVFSDMSSCMPHLVGTGNMQPLSPGYECCAGFTYVMSKNPDCICQAVGNAHKFGMEMNLTRVLALPSLCKVNAPNNELCNNPVPAGNTGNSPAPNQGNQAPAPSNSDTAPSQSPSGAPAPSPSQSPSGNGAPANPPSQSQNNGSAPSDAPSQSQNNGSAPSDAPSQSQNNGTTPSNNNNGAPASGDGHAPAHSPSGDGQSPSHSPSGDEHDAPSHAPKAKSPKHAPEHAPTPEPEAHSPPPENDSGSYSMSASFAATIIGMLVASLAIISV